MSMPTPVQIPSEIVQKWQGIVDLLAEIMRVPAALVMRVEAPNIKVFVSSESNGNPYEPDEVASLNTGLYCEAVMKTRQSLLVPDALVDEEWKSNPDIKLGMISYLGFPVTWPDGEIFGTICVLDNKKNEYGDVYRRLLRQCRDVLQADLNSLVRLGGELSERANLLNLSHDAIFVRDMNGVVKYWNRGAEELYGWTAEEAAGKVVPHLLKTVFPVPFEQIEAELRRVGRWEGELVHTKKDGTQIVVASRWSLQRDERAAPVAILVTNNDITERKRAEEALRQAQADLAHINRVSTMGELTSSLAHELNQPIAAAMTDASTCLRWLAKGDLEEAREAARRIVKDGTRAAEIIGRIRSFYKKSVPQHESVDVNHIAREMLVLLCGEATRYSISMCTALAVGLPKVRADRVQLQQVFMNLMLNGIEAMREVDGTRQLTITSELGEAGQLLISVKDTGVGLPSSEVDQIFNTFFTTKPQGIGMGLAISRSIIESHGGRLWASANTGPGAIFHFTLPTERYAG